MSIAIWTDKDGRVLCKNYRTDEISTSGASFVADSDGSSPATEPWEFSTEYYDEENGFQYEVVDATEGLTASEVTELKDSLGVDYSRATELMEKGINQVNN